MQSLTSGDRVLLVGDGNFTFAKALREHVKPEKLVASDLKASNGTTGKTLEVLRDLGVDVLHGLDATSHSAYKRVPFHPTVIVFNFPHTGVNQTSRPHEACKANRELVSRFFAAVPYRWRGATRILVTVKGGQHYDSWEVDTRGDPAGWLCVGSSPFDSDLWQSRGYKHAATTARVAVNISSATTYEFRHLDWRHAVVPGETACLSMQTKKSVMYRVVEPESSDGEASFPSSEAAHTPPPSPPHNQWDPCCGVEHVSIRSTFLESLHSQRHPEHVSTRSTFLESPHDQTPARLAGSARPAKPAAAGQREAAERCKVWELLGGWEREDAGAAPPRPAAGDAASRAGGGASTHSAGEGALRGGRPAGGNAPDASAKAEAETALKAACGTPLAPSVGSNGPRAAGVVGAGSFACTPLPERQHRRDAGLELEEAVEEEQPSCFCFIPAISSCFPSFSRFLAGSGRLGPGEK
ncbi:hypothetical protein DIPPA_23089 [Diplonema papillatum]|nr:hypothetical protein DIPPA_23089 [Diplonema papillatum]